MMPLLLHQRIIDFARVDLFPEGIGFTFSDDPFVPLTMACLT